MLLNNAMKGRTISNICFPTVLLDEIHSYKEEFTQYLLEMVIHESLSNHIINWKIMAKIYDYFQSNGYYFKSQLFHLFFIYT